MRKKMVLVLALAAFSLGACGKASESGSEMTALEERVIDAVMADYEEEFFLREDVVVDRIYRGAFLEPERKDSFVVCKIANMAHAGGLGRREGVLVDLQTMEVKGHIELPYDEISMTVVENADGCASLIVLGTVTYQGMSDQDVIRYKWEADGWVSEDVESISRFADEEHFLYMAEESMLVTYYGDDGNAKPLMEEYSWNPWNEAFELLDGKRIEWHEAEKRQQIDEILQQLKPKHDALEVLIESGEGTSTDPADTITVEENTYREVNVQFAASLQELEDALRNVYTDQYIEEHFEVHQNIEIPLFIEYEGALYRNMADGYPMIWEFNYTISKFAEDDIVLQFPDETADEEGINLEMELVNKAGNWLIHRLEFAEIQ